MQYKSKKIMSLAIISLFILSAFTIASIANVNANLFTALDYDTAIIRVANRILRYQAVDGAFDAECSWVDCSYGTGYTDVYDYNVLGRIGNTLLDAYYLTGDTYYLYGDATYPNVGAKKTADLLKTLHWADPLPTTACHWYTTAVKGRWRSDDYLFMLRYAAISGDTSYSTKAYEEWVSFKTECDNFRGCSPPIDPDDWINNMLTIYGYDESECMYEVAPYIYAAYVLGDTAWAEEVAVACTTDTTETGGSPDLVEMLDGETLEPGLAGALLFALQKLDPSTYAADIAVLTDWLKDTQNTDGSWWNIWDEIYQNTAWAIKGLGAVGEWEAAIDGADYLVSTQTTDPGVYKIGGYWESGYLGVYWLWVDAEAAQGLAQLSFNPIFRLEYLKTKILDAVANIEAKLDDINTYLTGTIYPAIDAIEDKLDSWFDTGGKFSNTAQATSGSGTTTIDATIYTNTKVGTVTVSFSTTGIGWGESVRVRYYIDPANSALYIQKTVTSRTNTLGWTDTAAAWQVEIDITGTGTVNWAYSVIYPP